jgi:hypothetical protein
MDYKQILTNYLTKTLGKSDAEISEMLFKKSDDGTLTEELSETALEQLEQAHAQHIQSVPSDELKKQFDEGHKKGKFEALSQEEEYIKKTYGVEGKGIRDMVAKAAQKSATLKEDDVLTHPLFVQTKADLEAQIEAAKQEAANEVAKVTGQIEKGARFNQALPKIDAALQEAGVNLESMRPQAKQAFLAQFANRDFEIKETGIFIKDETGNLLKDAHGNPVKLENHVKATAPDWFPIEKQPIRQAPGNDPTNPPQAKKWTKENVTKNVNDFQSIYESLPAEEKQEFLAAFEAANNPNAPAYPENK